MSGHVHLWHHRHTPETVCTKPVHVCAAPDLDAAWKAAEAALPEGWIGPSLVTETTTKSKSGITFEWRAFAWEYAKPHAKPPTGTGPTPAAALQALAARLGTTGEPEW